ncbi:hypothetical protein K9K77_01540 [Candidatus Babeliales bacterium]|nr:hypothetical protein [Candidatus Babeliales bacterium]
MKIIQTKKSVVMLFLFSSFFMSHAAEEEISPCPLSRSFVSLPLKGRLVSSQPGVHVKKVRFHQSKIKRSELVIVVNPKKKEENCCQKCYAESSCCQKTVCCVGTTLGISGLFAMMLFL